MSLLQIGFIRLKLLTSSPNPVLILPPPSKNGGITLEFIKAKNKEVELLDGSRRTRFVGYIPKLTVKYPVYMTDLYKQYATGTADGNMPTLAGLLSVLSGKTGTVAVAPGRTAPFFTCDSVSVKAISMEGRFSTGVEIVFMGRDVLSVMSL